MLQSSSDFARTNTMETGNRTGCAVAEKVTQLKTWLKKYFYVIAPLSLVSLVGLVALITLVPKTAAPHVPNSNVLNFHFATYTPFQSEKNKQAKVKSALPANKVSPEAVNSTATSQEVSANATEANKEPTDAPAQATQDLNAAPPNATEANEGPASAPAHPTEPPTAVEPEYGDSQADPADKKI